jgi:hypothetical protein
MKVLTFLLFEPESQIEINPKSTYVHSLHTTRNPVGVLYRAEDGWNSAQDQYRSPTTPSLIRDSRRSK